MSEHITVAVRIRPLKDSEKQPRKRRRQTLLEIPKDDQDLDRTLTVLDTNVILFGSFRLIDSQKRDGKRQYAFDVILDEECTQLDVFEKTSKPLIEHVLNGYNATVFAYGATGCGKTYTITGTEENPGIIYRTMHELYSQIELISKDSIIETAVSYLEVYNENIRDLFTKIPNQSLDLREDDTRVVVAGLSEIQPKDLSHMMKLLLRGNEQRSQAFTQANATSSRSHAVLQIHIRQKSRIPMGDQDLKVSTLSIIDLAGSERASATNNKGERLQEGANINRSLLALGNCINALCSDKPNHVPFRYRKNDQKFKINTVAKIHVESHIGQYPKIIEALRGEVTRLREELAASSSNTGVLTDEIKDYIGKSKSLFQKLQIKTAAVLEHETEIALNEFRIDQIRGILLAVAHNTQLDERKTLNDSILRLNEILDNLHSANVSIWHNADQNRSAIDRYQNQLEELNLEIPSKDFASKANFMLTEAKMEFEYDILQQRKATAIQLQENMLKESQEMLKANLEFFSRSLSRTQSLSDLLTTFVYSLESRYNLKKSEDIEIEYDTCTEDHQSDTTFTEAISELKMHEPEREELPALPFEKTPMPRTPRHLNTPQQNEMEDMDATPVARKVKNTPRNIIRGTPKKLVKKTPSRRKMRMSMIPLPRLEKQEDLSSIRSRLRERK